MKTYKILTLFPLILLMISLCACGFKPLYSSNETHEGNAPYSPLAEIEISNIPDEEGQILRNHLIDRFYASGYPQNPKYRLDVARINAQTRDLDVTIRSDATREQIRLTTQLALFDIEAQKVILTRSLSAVGSYNVLESQYTTYVSRSDIRENLIQDLALQVERHVMLAVERQHQAQ